MRGQLEAVAVKIYSVLVWGKMCRHVAVLRRGSFQVLTSTSHTMKFPSSDIQFNVLGLLASRQGLGVTIHFSIRTVAFNQSINLTENFRG